MDLRKLRHAVTLAHWKNFTKSAQALNITQSALSRSIQALEDELGLQLFDRNRKTVDVTQAGREVLRLAEIMLRSEAELKGVAAQSATGEGGRVVMGMTPLTARLLLAEVLSVRIDQPHFHAEIITAPRPQLIAMVMQERVDMCVVASDKLLSYVGLSSIHLARLSMALIVRRDHPLTRIRHLTQDDVARYPTVRATPHSFDEAHPSLFGPLQNAPPALTVEDHDVLCDVTATSNAVWVASPLLASRGIEEGKLVELPLSWLDAPPRMSLFAYFPARRTLFPSIEGMVAHMQAIGSAFSLP